MDTDQNRQEQGHLDMTEWQKYMHKYVKVSTVDGQEYRAYMDGFDGQHLYLLIPHKLREENEQPQQPENNRDDEERAWGYPGGFGGYGYPGFGGYGFPGGYGHGYPGGFGGYGHPGYGYPGYPGYAGYGRYGYGRFILPLAALGGLALI